LRVTRFYGTLALMREDARVLSNFSRFRGT
jgi:hypothetical protein